MDEKQKLVEDQRKIHHDEIQMEVHKATSIVSEGQMRMKYEL